VVLGAGSISRGVMAIGEAFGMRVIGLTSQSSVVELVQAMAEHVRAYAAERGKGGG
jgi:phosphoglycerate dehydrogenase-like enzyme